MAYDEVRRGVSESLRQHNRGTREVGAYFRFYNNHWPHQILGYRTPAEVFHGAAIAPDEESKTREVSPEQVLVSTAGASGVSLNSTSILPN